MLSVRMIRRVTWIVRYLSGTLVLQARVNQCCVAYTGELRTQPYQCTYTVLLSCRIMSGWHCGVTHKLAQVRPQLFMCAIHYGRRVAHTIAGGSLEDRESFSGVGTLLGLPANVRVHGNYHGGCCESTAGAYRGEHQYSRRISRWTPGM